jgi:hypothetical protein
VCESPWFHNQVSSPRLRASAVKLRIKAQKAATGPPGALGSIEIETGVRNVSQHGFSILIRNAAVNANLLLTRALPRRLEGAKKRKISFTANGPFTMSPSPRSSPPRGEVEKGKESSDIIACLLRLKYFHTSCYCNFCRTSIFSSYNCNR